MRFPIAMDQHADIMILGENDPPFGDSFSRQSPITRIRRSFAEIDDVVAGGRISRTACATMLESARKRTLFRGDRQTFRSR
jgi:hypothetical protein